MPQRASRYCQSAAPGRDTFQAAAGAGVTIGFVASVTGTCWRRATPGLGRQFSSAAFLQPVLLLAAATAALSAGVGFLPVLAGQHHLGPIAAGALVSLLAAAAVLQPFAGRRIDDGRLRPAAAADGLAACAAGFLLAITGLPGLIAGSLLIGAGVATATPAGFARLTAITPPGQLGRTMGAAEAGRELGDAGGPVLVGAFGLIGLTAGPRRAVRRPDGLRWPGRPAQPREPSHSRPASREHRPAPPFSQAEGRLGPDDHPTH